MMERLRVATLTFVLATALPSTAAIAGTEKAVELSDLPADVIAAAREHLGDLRLAHDAAGPVDDGSVIDDNLVIVYEELGEVELTGANTETEEDGSYVFEIQGKVGDGRRVEIDVDPTANVLEIEVEFDVEDVPGAVIQSVEAQLPGFTPTFIEANHSPSMQVVGYEIVGTRGEEELDIEVSPDGRRITLADK